VCTNAIVAGTVGRMPNRLKDATSPYLLQHKDNPVDWWPWCEEAFEEARTRDVPILLSVGYAACHWCHVMAHESFEDADTAAAMNSGFVCIKVDREERPDVDAVYMEATQAMTGHGGWPMTAFLTPDGEPFYCGTYFPPLPRYGMPSFRQVLDAVTSTWRERRDEARAAGQDVVRRLSERGAPPDSRPVSAGLLDAAVIRLDAEEDRQHGGFGGAPKFPPSMVLEFLLRHHARTGSDRALGLVERTCEAMARGGIYDQLAGGFARYSVDAEWAVPHFEKMLYDNALLARAYLHWWRSTGSALGRRIAEETCDWMLSDLRTSEGGFASALDADTEGVEGATYVWKPDEMRAILGAEDGAWAASLLGVDGAGNVEDGASTLRLPRDPDDAARWSEVRGRLLGSRRARPQPARDDKVVAAWNGLAVTALAEAGALLDRPDFLAAAEAAAELLLEVHLVGGRLRRTSRDGRAGDNSGVLEDYADVAEAFLTLHAVTGAFRWYDLAGDLLEAVLAHFPDGRGGFFDTADDAERLVRRPQEPTDNATPAGLSATAGALLGFAALSGSSRHRSAAEAALATVASVIERFPRYAGWAAAVGEAVLAGPAEVAVVGASDDPRTGALVQAVLASPSPGAALSWTASGTDLTPLLEGRPLVAGGPAAYVCRRFVCAAPETDPQHLARALLT
jgi:uncharacterized protein YyaL (SSP411 family)